MKNTVWYVAGGITAVFLGTRLFHLSQLGKMLIMENTLRIHTLYPFTLAANVTLKNPSQASIKVKHPVVALYTDEQARKANAPFASSNPQPKDYIIPRSGIVKLDPILLVLPLSVAPAYGEAVLNGQPIQLFIRKSTWINNTIPYVVDEVQTFLAKE